MENCKTTEDFVAFILARNPNIEECVVKMTRFGFSPEETREAIRKLQGATSESA